jgi:hypothetical protein
MREPGDAMPATHAHVPQDLADAIAGVRRRRPRAAAYLTYAQTMRHHLVATSGAQPVWNVYDSAANWEGAYLDVRDAVQAQYSERVITEYRLLRRPLPQLLRPGRARPTAHWVLHNVSFLNRYQRELRPNEVLDEAVVLEAPVIAEAAGLVLREVPLRIELPGLLCLATETSTPVLLEAALVAWAANSHQGFRDVLAAHHIAAGL